MQTIPGPVGLYDPRFEHDSCGVSFVANIKGARSHELVRTGLEALTNLAHRGATGAEADTGDGAGILVQVPDRFLRAVIDADLPPPGAYAVGLAFLPTDTVAAEKAEAAIEAIVAEEGLEVVAWRPVPVEPDCLGATARAAMPRFKHLVLADPGGARGIDLDRRVYVARKRIEHELDAEIATYFASLSARTLVYKGMLTTPQLAAFFPDLSDERFESALLLIHSRFSTNTFPTWPLAHPVPLHRPQRRDQHGAGQPELDAGARGDAGEPAAPRPRAGVPDLHARRLGHRPLRRGARAAPPRRASDPPRRVDDDPGGVGERRRDGRRPAGVLPLPLLADGAVGRPGQRRVHGRHRHRRRARPQRAAAEPLLGHRRRHRRDGVRGRRRRRRPGEGDHQGPAAAGADVPHRHRRGAHRRRRGDQDHPRRRASVRRVAGARARRVRRSPAARARGVQPRQRAAPPAALRLHARRAQGDPRPDGAQWRRTDRVDGHGHPDRRALGAPAAAVRLLRPALRPGDEPAPRRHPRGGRDVGGVHRRSRGQPARARSAELSPAGPAVPDHRQRRAGEDHPRRRRRSLPRPAGTRRQGAVPGGRRWAGAGAGADRDLRRGVGRDRGAARG